MAPAFRDSTCSFIWSFRAIGTAGNRTSPNCHPGQALSIISGLSIVGILGSVSTGNISVTTSLVSANGMYLGRPVSVGSFFMTISSSDQSHETIETTSKSKITISNQKFTRVAPEHFDPIDLNSLLLHMLSAKN